MARGNTAFERHPDRCALVWIEDSAGAIARGQAQTLTISGARVRLAEKPPGFGVGDEVALRICLDPDAPTVATTARVRWIHAGEGTVECELEWTAPTPQRTAFAAWLSSAA